MEFPRAEKYDNGNNKLYRKAKPDVNHHALDLVSPINAAQDPSPATIQQSLGFLLFQRRLVALQAKVCELLLSTGNVQKLAIRSLEHGDTEG
jgi:hypothetical protein